MNSPSCITPSSRASGRAAALALAAALFKGSLGAVSHALLACSLSACGGSRPAEEASPRREAAAASPDPAKGQGVVTFHYSNKSTAANLQIDLGATDISLEMTGKPAEEMKAAQAAQEQRKKPAPEAKGPEEESAAEEEKADPRQARKEAAKKPAKPEARPQPEQLPEDPGPGEPPADVTDKVLLGIRKAQEFFYQKRYPEALEMVRSSLDARPTAEGHALAGSVHYMMGATGLARRHWQQALRLNPDMPAVVNMLEKIATPGGRGSPHPRPLAPRRAAAAPSPQVLEAAAPTQEAPFPEEFNETAAPPRAPEYRAPERPAAPASAPAAPAAAPAAPIEEAAVQPAPAAAPVAAPAKPAAAAAPETQAAPAQTAAPEAAPAPKPEAAAAKPAAEAPAKPKFPQKAPAGQEAAANKDVKKDKSP